MNKTPLPYFLLIILISASPLALPLIKNLQSKIPSIIQVIPQNPVANYDENDHLEYTITGEILDFPLIPNRRELFLKLYLLNRYRVGPFSLTIPQETRLIPTYPEGTFTVANIPPGNYRLVPQTDPQHGLFFTQDYPLTLAGRNPPPLIIVPPTSSPIIYLKTLITHLLTGT